MRKTAFYEKHIAHSGKMVDFGGWELPVHYEAGIVEEHKRVRSAAGLFDVSHMGEVRVTGPKAEAWLQNMMSNDITIMEEGQVIYTFMCYPNGGVVDDLLVYKVSTENYFLVINASNTEKDVLWLHDHVSEGVHVENLSPQYSELALQGPKAEEILTKITNFDVASLGFFRFVENVNVAGVNALVSRTGYTGEDGFEIYIPWDEGAKVWDAIMEAGQDFGILPAGLGCRDSLRFEAGLPLYGHELAAHITPLEAGLGFFVKLDKQFIGRNALAALKENGVPRKIIGLEMIDKGIPREQYEVKAQGRTVGRVTTGGFSPSLDKSIASALVEAPFVNEEEMIIVIHGKEKKAKKVKRPFYQKHYKR
ncbi:MAG: glycine cleavage system aminomethyltransferase GcvT [Aminobacterium sp.]|uniref:glycine cleavage system aminomethyltransferase GcvT n=1 Tax=Aminobacterium sp. TaxID=1872491 RepID=UPI001BD081A4|nr:glycine cleavage system aminomethyltransferase GcvT [Aminobacterium sp.]MDD3426155.1 glycine cleavage system aminomethyltransferase GcvT [Aminobacterium sp.]MEA4877409.1 glycine cleavage system aminomethyltransferase GcvT [Aminobacterium sp.]